MTSKELTRVLFDANTIASVVSNIANQIKSVRTNDTGKRLGLIFTKSVDFLRFRTFVSFIGSPKG